MSNIYQNKIHLTVAIMYDSIMLLTMKLINSVLRSTETNELLLPIHRTSTALGHRSAITCFNKYTTEINRFKIEDMSSQ